MRLNEQIDAEAHEVRDKEPDDAQSAFGDKHHAALAATKAEPFVDRVKDPFDPLEEAAEEIDGEPEKAHHRSPAESLPTLSGRVPCHFLEVPADAGVDRHHDSQIDTCQANKPVLIGDVAQIHDGENKRRHDRS